MVYSLHIQQKQPPRNHRRQRQCSWSGACRRAAAVGGGKAPRRRAAAVGGGRAHWPTSPQTEENGDAGPANVPPAMVAAC